MKTIKFEVHIEVHGFDDAQDASEWLSEEIENFAMQHQMTIFDFDVMPDVALVDYSAQ